MTKYDLPKFKKAMENFSKRLPTGTHWRYSNGMLPPPLGPLLIENPELAVALAEDALALARQRNETNEERPSQ
jgi:hypothetical protein